MPLYRYRCAGCGAEFDEFRPVSLREHAPCVCGKTAFMRFDPSQTQFFIPPHMRSNAGDERYRAWAESDEVKAGLKSGRYERLKRGKTPFPE